MKNKHVIVSRYGGPEVLQVVEDEIQEPRAGEVRVKILAAGVAWGDVLKRSGLGTGVRPPFTPGYDIVGRVEKVGDDVSSVKVGQMVAALPIVGGYSEYVCLPSSELVQVPSDLDPAQAVCLVMNYVVAYQLLHRAAQVKPGERVLMYSAAGGVGTALLQLGHLSQLKMYGTASSDKQGLIARLGGTPIDYKKEEVAKRIFALADDGVDVVFDPIGGTHIWQSYRMLRKGGRLIVYGAHTAIKEGVFKVVLGFILGSFLNLIPGKKILNYNITRSKYSTPEWCRDDLSKLFELLAQGKIEPIIAERMPLVEAARAHELLERGSVTGKIALICNI